MYGLVVVGYKYLIQIQQSELIIERVLLDRGQTRLKEFLNSSVDPIVVCSVNNIKQENLDDSEIKLLEPEEIVVCNDAAKKLLQLSNDETNFRLRELAAATSPMFRTNGPLQSGESHSIDESVTISLFQIFSNQTHFNDPRN